MKLKGVRQFQKEDLSMCLHLHGQGVRQYCKKLLVLMVLFVLLQKMSRLHNAQMRKRKVSESLRSFAATMDYGQSTWADMLKVATVRQQHK